MITTDASTSTRVPVEAGFAVPWTVTVAGWVPGPRLPNVHTTRAACWVGARRSITVAGPPSTEIVAMPRSGPRVDTQAPLPLTVQVKEFSTAFAPGFVAKCTDPP